MEGVWHLHIHYFGMLLIVIIIILYCHVVLSKSILASSEQRFNHLHIKYDSLKRSNSSLKTATAILACLACSR